MAESRHYTEWLDLRQRLLREEREFARTQQAVARGEPVDLEALSIKESEIRALRALSRALIRRSLPQQATSEGPGRE